MTAVQVVHALKGILLYSSWKINVDYGYVNIMIQVYAFDNCNLLSNLIFRIIPEFRIFKVLNWNNNNRFSYLYTVCLKTMNDQFIIFYGNQF